MKSFWVILITIITSGGLVGGGSYCLLENKATKEKNELESQITVAEATVNKLSTEADALSKARGLALKYSGWKTLPLTLTSSTIKYPSTWTVARETDAAYPKQVIGYTVDYNNTTKESKGSIAEYDADEWVKGAAEGEGYVLTKAQRASLLETVKKLYTAGKLTDQLKTELDKYGVEFMTYSTTDRVYVDYLVSNDGKAKGISMFNTHGQDVGLTTDYQVFLYNQEKNTVLSTFYRVSGSELDKIREQYGNYTGSNLETIDKKAHTDFANLILNTKRSDLSFASMLDNVDNMIKSWTY